MHFLLSVDKMEVYEKQCPLDMTPKTSKIQQELYVEAECMGLTSSQPSGEKAWPLAFTCLHEKQGNRASLDLMTGQEPDISVAGWPKYYNNKAQV